MDDFPARKRARLESRAQGDVFEEEEEDWGDDLHLTADQLEAIDELASQAYDKSNNPPKGNTTTWFVPNSLPSTACASSGSTSGLNLVAPLNAKDGKAKLYLKKPIAAPAASMDLFMNELNTSAPTSKIIHKPLRKNVSLTDIDVFPKNDDAVTKKLRDELNKMKVELKKVEEDKCTASGESKMLRENLQHVKSELEQERIKYQEREAKWIKEQELLHVKLYKQIEKLNTELGFKDQEISELKKQCRASERRHPTNLIRPAKHKFPEEGTSFLGGTSSKKKDVGMEVVTKRKRQYELRIRFGRGKIERISIVSHVLHDSSSLGSHSLTTINEQDPNCCESPDKPNKATSSLKERSASKEDLSVLSHSRFSCGLGQLVQNSKDKTLSISESLRTDWFASLIPVTETHVKLYLEMVRCLADGKGIMAFSPKKPASIESFFGSSSSDGSSNSNLNDQTETVAGIEKDAMTSLRTLKLLVICDSKCLSAGTGKQNVANPRVRSTNPYITNLLSSNFGLLNDMVSIIRLHNDVGSRITQFEIPFNGERVIEIVLDVLGAIVAHCGESVTTVLRSAFTSGDFGGFVQVGHSAKVVGSCLSLANALVAKLDEDSPKSSLCSRSRGRCFLLPLGAFCAAVGTSWDCKVATRVLLKVVDFMSNVITQHFGPSSLIHEGPCITEFLNRLMYALCKELELYETNFEEKRLILLRKGSMLLHFYSSHYQVRRDINQYYYGCFVRRLTKVWRTLKDQLYSQEHFVAREMWDFDRSDADRMDSDESPMEMN